jgi:hypothetical protein
MNSMQCRLITWTYSAGLAALVKSSRPIAPLFESDDRSGSGGHMGSVEAGQLRHVNKRFPIAAVGPQMLTCA